MTPDATFPYGGMVRTSGAYPKSDEEVERDWQRFESSIRQGLANLAAGAPPVAVDCEVVPGAEVEMFDYFDIESGEHVMAWRVPCRRIGRQ
jgi:hypothetical protein